MAQGTAGAHPAVSWDLTSGVIDPLLFFASRIRTFALCSVARALAASVKLARALTCPVPSLSAGTPATISFAVRVLQKRSIIPFVVVCVTAFTLRASLVTSPAGPGPNLGAKRATTVQDAPGELTDLKAKRKGCSMLPNIPSHSVVTVAI